MNYKAIHRTICITAVFLANAGYANAQLSTQTVASMTEGCENPWSSSCIATPFSSYQINASTTPLTVSNSGGLSYYGKDQYGNVVYDGTVSAAVSASGQSTYQSLSASASSSNSGIINLGYNGYNGGQGTLGGNEVSAGAYTDSNDLLNFTGSGTITLSYSLNGSISSTGYGDTFSGWGPSASLQLESQLGGAVISAGAPPGLNSGGEVFMTTNPAEFYNFNPSTASGAFNYQWTETSNFNSGDQLQLINVLNSMTNNGNATATLQLTNIQITSGTSVIDTAGAINISAVPEPKKYLMLLAGLCLIGSTIYRRKGDSSGPATDTSTT